MKIYNIKLSEISSNDEFRFTSGEFSSKMKESIIRSGVVNPIFVVPYKKDYKVIAGFKRYNCVLQLKYETIPAKIIAPEMIPEIFRDLILEHLSYNKLNIIEKAKILKIYKKIGIDQIEQRMDYVKIIDVPPRKVIIEKILNLLKFPDAIQKYIEEYDISLKQTEIFQRFNTKINNKFIKMAENLKIRSVELEKIMTFFEDIAGRESITVDAIFGELDINSVLKNKSLSRNQKIQEINKRLQQRRYTKLCQWNTKLDTYRKKLDLPDCMYICWDSSLERPGLKLTAHLRTKNDIELSTTFYSQKNTRETLIEMLGLV